VLLVLLAGVLAAAEPPPPPPPLLPKEAALWSQVVRSPWGDALEAQGVPGPMLRCHLTVPVNGWEGLVLTATAGGAALPAAAIPTGTAAGLLPVKPPVVVTVALPMLASPYRRLDQVRLSLTALVPDGGRTEWTAPAEAPRPPVDLPGGGNAELLERKGERLVLRLDRAAALRLVEVQARDGEGKAAKLRSARRDPDGESARIVVDAAFGSGGTVVLLLAESVKRTPLSWSAEVLELGFAVPAQPAAPSQRAGAEEF
jgi:hypothetical protein